MLKPNLIEHHDYEAIPEKVWYYLVCWYKFLDKSPIVRPVKFDRKIGRYFIDLYPEQNQSRMVTDSFVETSISHIVDM